MKGDSDADRGSGGSAVVGEPEAGLGHHLTRLGDARRPVALRRWFFGSAFGHLWHRLMAIDVISRGMLFAAILLLCFVPFMIVVEALAGQDAATSLVRRFGLDSDASRAVGRVFTSAADTSSAISGLSWLFFVLGGLAAAAAIQELYQAAFDVKGRGAADMPRRIAWLASLLAVLGLVGWVQPWLHDVGGAWLVGFVAMIGAIGFWWFSMRLLLGGQLTWKELFPSALATGVCWFGMTVVFRLTMSNTITSDDAKYGAIGVVFALMSFLIAVGVVVMAGAIFGVVWRERHRGVSAATPSMARGGDHHSDEHTDHHQVTDHL